MSDIILHLTLTVTDDKQENWQEVLQGMANEELGATLEERISAFGSKAEDKLEAIMDDWEASNGPPTFDSFWRDGNEMGITMETGIAGDEKIHAMIELFKICGAQVSFSDHSLADSADGEMD